MQNKKTLAHFCSGVTTYDSDDGDLWYPVFSVIFRKLLKGLETIISTYYGILHSQAIP